MPSPLLRPDPRLSGNSNLFSSPFTAQEGSPAPLNPLRVRARAPDTEYEQRDPLDPLTEDEEPPEDGIADEDEVEEISPLLPIFSAPHLDSLPTYHLTHTIRMLVAARCETTLTWEQLRSPQVSQFLLKPIQQEIHTAHFSRATLYALMANCLQFIKEVDLNPGNSGTSKTRAMVCELLAIKLLKEYTTRELIDALSYDFWPLQGQAPPPSSSTLRGPSWNTSQRSKPYLRAARISCLEIAIRAQAKRFLAHPLVVQQLEAVWAGNVVFHAAADYIHRQPQLAALYSRRGYGSTAVETQGNRTINNSYSPDLSSLTSLRRSATLYNPRDASLFKLSRLRVPRYRQFLSTCSFAILLVLFLAVIQDRSLTITSMEVIFWLWSAGFMLDELVGFNEQGFSLYLMSFWNTFDLGILLLLFCYYCLRIYGVVAPESRKQDIATLAYDVLAANAVLLLPRLFSVLDHYRYFSQLLVAFRMMVADFIAVFILIIIACSGFFVAFTFSSNSTESPGSVIYALFQMLMGFTPAAWKLWDGYNTLGKAILTLFLFICHFLVVTILITVLTNSFMAIVQNANEEHQFVFAVNTLSMVKSDALFSYVAPTNILAWLIVPLRFVMPLPKFVKLNRTVIKVTHFPILFTIYLYERTLLQANAFEPTDLVERRNRSGSLLRRKLDFHRHFDALSQTTRRVREPSVTTHHKDLALEEVFRRPFKDTTYRGSQKSQYRQRTSNVVHNWMQNMGPDTTDTPPEEQDSNTVDHLGDQRLRKSRFLQGRLRGFSGTMHNFTETTRSIASDPEDFISGDVHRPGLPRLTTEPMLPPMTRYLSRQTDIEGDDELTSSDNDQDDDSAGEKDGVTHAPSGSHSNPTSPTVNWGTATTTVKSSRPSTAKLISRRNSPSRRPKTPRRHHRRGASGGTVLYNPTGSDDAGGESGGVQDRTQIQPFPPRVAIGLATPDRLAGRRAPKDITNRARPRPIVNRPKSEFMSVPDMSDNPWLHDTSRSHRRRSSLDLDLGSDLGDNKAVAGALAGAVPSSFATQMAYATGGLRRPTASGTNSQDMLSKLVLARMKTLEEGFQEVIKEVKDLRRRDDDDRVRGVRAAEDVRRPKGTRKDGKKRPQEARRGKSNSNSDAGSERGGLRVMRRVTDENDPMLGGSSV
ncbi:hypothetical protein AJ80_05160 [Polytolypa hystricis UAMH7299]|uniref:Ion transport domain-containing protein n=1 Tax=Polytolypa hystricis (strain UAMH7299) TaxID=1447883 RepID=A0A2B7Y4N9_POLH7|nr:hypothetical protein AJ80_05160 [Polytolypa hystricis UAMH7299]